MKKQYKILLIIAIILMVIAIAVLGYGYYKKATEVVQNPIVTMEVEGYGTVKIELYPDIAPNTVAHFIKKINEGFYDGLTFHRTIPDFMIQGGDKEGTGSGELDYALPGEFIANGFSKNTLKHTRGVLSMARADYSSYGSGLTSYSYNSGRNTILHNDRRQSFTRRVLHIIWKSNRRNGCSRCNIKRRSNIQ